jgi:hypothetical protein
LQNSNASIYKLYENHAEIICPFRYRTKLGTIYTVVRGNNFYKKRFMSVFLIVYFILYSLEIIPVKSGSVGVMSQGQQIGSGSVVVLPQGQQKENGSVGVMSQGQHKGSGSVGVMSQSQQNGSGSVVVLSQGQQKESGSVGVMSQGQQKGSGNMSVLPGHSGSVSFQGSSHHSVSGHATITGNNVGGENCFGPACSAKNGFHSGK